jgi:hypothetical protein
MISLEKAAELKAAGLPWEPQMYDIFAMVDNDKGGRFIDNSVIWEQSKADAIKEFISQREDEWFVWLPSLSQILAAIEAAGWVYRFGPAANGKFVCHLGKFDRRKSSEPILEAGFYEEIPEDAAAEALLWIQWQKGEKNNADL